MHSFKDRFDEKTYRDGPSCLISLFDEDIIPGTEVRLPIELLSRLISLGRAYSLYYIPLLDPMGHIFYEKEQSKGLREEVVFIREVTNDSLLHNYLNKILPVLDRCITENKCKVLINAN